MKARDVRPGTTVMCCRSNSPHHHAAPVTVTRIYQPRGSRHLAFAYTDRTGAARDLNGITVPYLPDDEVPTP